MELILRPKPTPQDSLQSLRQLQLRELTLLDCGGLELELFTPGALTSLRNLHVEDSACRLNRSGRVKELLDQAQVSPSVQARVQRARGVGEIVLQLPELHQVSGLCDLFMLGMRSGLRLGGWYEADLPAGTMVTSAHHRCHFSRLKLWHISSRL